MAFGSVFDWQNVLGDSWLFDQGSTFGYRPERGGSVGLRGPAPDWSLGDSGIPLIHFQRHWNADVSATTYPGSILLSSASRGLQFGAHLAFDSANLSLVKLTLDNAAGGEPSRGKFSISGSGVNVSATPGLGISFGLPQASIACFAHPDYRGGRLFLTQSVLVNGDLHSLAWNVTANLSHFEASSEQVHIPAGGVVTAFAFFVPVMSNAAGRPDVRQANERFGQSILRWEGYLQVVLGKRKDASMEWSAVKSVMTLMGNWRFVPGLPSGVLPSYVGYEGGFWSWDTYKQAVGMVHFVPELAKDQLRLLTSARDSRGHVPDKVDRCGLGGGCSGKPPLLGWAVWQVFQKTHDLAFLRDMYSIIRDFHHFWYAYRDVTGDGLCSWTEGMESGMDDGVRFQPEFAKSVTNTSSHVLCPATIKSKLSLCVHSGID